MKSRLLLLTTLLGLAPMTLASCGSQSSSAAPVHVHTYGDWVYTDENVHTRTCTDCEEGTEGHSVSEAHSWDDGVITVEPTHTTTGTKKYTCTVCGGTKTETVDKTSEHTFDQEIVSGKYLASAATCTEPAEYYYSCECGEAGTETFSYGDPLGHDITSLSIVSAPTKLSYEAYETFDPAGLSLSGVCSRGDEVAVDLSDVTFEYANGGTSFRVGETSVTARYSNYSVEITGISVSKTTASIDGVSDISIHCGQEVSFDAVTSRYGNVAITVVDKDGYAVSDLSALKAEGSPYTYVARLNGSDDYDEVNESANIFVTHDYTDNYCGCGDVYAIDNVYYDLNKGEFITANATGDMKDEIIARLPTEVEFTAADAGENRSLTVELSEDESVTFDVLVVSGVITTSDEFLAATDASAASVSGYYILGNDLDTVTTTSNGSHTNTTGVKFTLDGQGHTINKLSVAGKTGGIFGTCGAGSGADYDVTLKNLTIKSLVNTQYGMLGYMPANSNGQSVLFENVKLTVGKDYSNGFISATGIMSQFTFRNCVFDYNDYQNTYMFYATAAYANFENVTIKIDAASTTMAIDKGHAADERDGLVSKIDGVTFVSAKVSTDYAMNADNFSVAVPFTESSQSGYQMWTRKFVTDEVLGDTSDKLMCKTSTYVPNYGGFKVLFNEPITVTDETKYIHIRACISITDYDGTATSTNLRGYRTDTPTISDYDSTHRPENITVSYNAWTDCYLTVEKYAIDGVLNGFVLCTENPGLSSYASAVYLSTVSIQSYK